MGPIGKPEDVSPPDGIAVNDRQFAKLMGELKKAPGLFDPVVEIFKQLGVVVRPETAKEREERLRDIAPADLDLSKVFMMRKVTDKEFEDALNKTQARYDREMWPQVTSRAWLLFRRLRGDLRDGRTKLTINPDGTVSPKNLPPLPQFPSIREFRPGPQA